MAGAITNQLPLGQGQGWDPNGILQGFYPWTDLSKWGAYGPAIQSVLSLLRGPNIAAQAGTQAATQAADQAASQYQGTVRQGQQNLASRGLVGSGASQDVVSGALDTLSGSLAGGAATGANITQQMMQQLRQQVLGQLNNISSGQNQGTASIQSANIGLDSARSQADALRAGLFGNIFGTGADILGTLALGPSSRWLPLASFLGRGAGGALGYGF